MTLSAFARASAVVWGVTLAVACGVALVPGAALATQTALAFAPEPRPGTTGELLHVAAGNARVLALILLAAIVARACPSARPVLAGAVWTTAATNAVLVGLALGSYGPAAARWLPHLPLEWSALAGALALFADTRENAPSTSTLLRGAGIVIAALAVAAAIEVYATPQ